MMLDVVQRVLTWFLTFEVVELCERRLIAIGIPPMFAAVVAIVGLMLLIHKVADDRYMIQRWRRKWRI